MEADAARVLAAGFYAFALMGAALAIGNIFASYLQGALRNPSAAGQERTMVYIGFALAEATGLFGLVVAFILIFT